MFSGVGVAVGGTGVLVGGRGVAVDLVEVRLVVTSGFGSGFEDLLSSCPNGFPKISLNIIPINKMAINNKTMMKIIKLGCLQVIVFLGGFVGGFVRSC